MVVIPTDSLDIRPDLKSDHELWERLLQTAKKYHDNTGKFSSMYRILEYFRSQGTRIKVSQSGNYVLRPDVDISGYSAWRSLEEYDAAAAKWFEPNKDILARLLKNLREG